MPGASRLSRPDRFCAWTCLLLGALWFSVGCNPTTLGLLLAPWVDDKIPAKCKLSSKDKEVTIALVCNFTNPVTRMELIAADNELAERLIHAANKSFKDNKEKVKFVSLGQVRAYQAKMSAGGVVSDQEIGKHFNADYVLGLDINSMDLYAYKSSQLFQGRTNITVRVSDMSKPAGEGIIFDQPYMTEFPRQGPDDAGNGNVLQFRARFLTRVASDLTRWFSAYPSDEKFTMD